MEIEISEIHSFQGHPFKVVDDDRMQELVESIKANGVLSPVLIRPDEKTGGYEMISGHRRMHAAMLAGLERVPAIIREMSDDEAVIMMVDANIQREELLPSEKAFAYKMKLNAMKRQAGRPSKDNSCQIGPNLRSDQEMADQVGESARSIQRYIRLTELIPSLLNLVDQKRLQFTVAVEISYLEKRVQQWVYEYMDNCAVMMFLGAGAGAEDTHKYISELLGKQTIDTVNDGKSGQNGSTNYNKMGRELMTPSEVRRMERKDCIIFMEGEQPIYDRKALPWEMPEEEVPFQEAMLLASEGGYVNPAHVVEDQRTGELFTIREDQAPVRKDTGRKAGGKVYDVNDRMLMYQNFGGSIR